MKIKKGDKVIVITGKDAGKTGTVLHAMPKENRVLVEGVNMRTKHEKPRGNRKGQIVERSVSLHVSNVMIVDPKTGKGSRIKVSRENGTRTRISKRSGTQF